MSAKRILLATDFSPPGVNALEWASDLAFGADAKLLILHVEPGQPAGRVGAIYSGIPDPGIAEIAKSLAAIRPTRPNVPCEHLIRAGDPATEILALAQEEAIDAIVMGSHGRGGARRWLLGSVAEAVLHKAMCPVMICREREQPS
jgi:nucleotide-binding universal stress UspA family protein